MKNIVQYLHRFMHLFCPKISKNDSRKPFIKKLLDSILYVQSFSVHNIPSYLYDLILPWSDWLLLVWFMGEAYLLPQTAEWVILPPAERGMFEDSAEGRRLFICRSRRMMKNLRRGSQISFTIRQKIGKKKYSLKSFQTQTDSY